MVGNDILDIHFLDSPPYQHIDYLRRACTPQEFTLVCSAPDPSLTLLALWAAKEAAYKAVAQVKPGRFVPRRFDVRLNQPVRRNSRQIAQVTFGARCCKVELSITGQWLHAIATGPEVSRIRSAVRKVERCYRQHRRAHDESEAVRFLAAELISTYCSQPLLLQFDSSAPVLIDEQGRRCELNLSFSHHGKFAAVALAWPHARPVHLSDADAYCARRAWEETCFTCTV